MSSENTYVDVELFAGAGGLAVGLASAGLCPHHLFESDSTCVATLSQNIDLGFLDKDTSLHYEDVNRVDWAQISKPVRLLSGGPPCQPFSLGGKHLAERDGRNLFPATFRAVRELGPKIVLLENVPGLVRTSFRPYFDYILDQLTFPSIAPRKNELWNDHNRRIQWHKRQQVGKQEYSVQWWLLNAADFGVAQARVRLVIVATRSDVSPIAQPIATHSRSSLIADQVDGSYWLKRNIRRRLRKVWPKRIRAQGNDDDTGRLPWRTVRDAIANLHSPTQTETGDHHWLIPGARLYSHHSGSELDWPAKTIKAGVHGVAGGENILLLDNGRYRYFTLREMATLQGFPAGYKFSGSRSRIIRQIGNAVPVDLAKRFGQLIAKSLKNSAED